MKEIYKIKDLEQVRLLSDPLKLRLLQAFAESAKTTKQAAAELGESVTKLYRHVDALHDSGLLVVVAERQKRGTIERTFRAVAQRFEADQSLFSGDTGGEATAAALEVLRATEAEILDVLANVSDEEDERPILMRIRGKASPAKIAELQATLNAWLDSIPKDDSSPTDEAEQIGGFIAFYRVD
jgi:predicted ArsR family transcriptional regulator